MEYVIRTVGLRRIITAAIGGAVTRPLGMHGTFYRLAGSVARDVDGGPPPYEHVLFPPLDTKVAQRICADLERALDIGVSIVDLNDFGGSIRAVSPRSLSAGDTLEPCSATTRWANSSPARRSSRSARLKDAERLIKALIKANQLGAK